MGWTDYLNPISDVSKLYNYAKSGTGYGNLPQQPGVGGPAGPQSQLVQDPTTGMFYDPSTGTSYTDASGSTPITNPNIAQQVAQNFNTRTALLAKLGGNQATIDSAVGGQKALAGSLTNTINNPAASSVAQTQLGLGADAIARQQMQQAAGTTGANSTLALRNAANNIGAGQTALNGQQALTRATEVSNAQGRLGSVLNQQAQEGQAGYNADLGGAEQEGSQAMTGQSGQQGMNQAAATGSQKNTQDFWNKLIGGVSSAGTVPGASGG